MNERIKELAEQADAYAHNRMAEIGGSYLEYYNEKFAELIVRECVKVCSGVEEDGELSPELGTFADGALLCREEIKAHFGV